MSKLIKFSVFILAGFALSLYQADVVLAAEQVQGQENREIKPFQAAHAHAAESAVTHMADLQAIQGVVEESEPMTNPQTGYVHPHDPRVVLFQ